MRVLSALGAFKEAPENVVQLNCHISTCLRQLGHRVEIFPLADGGDGTLETISFHSPTKSAAHFKKQSSVVNGPLGNLVYAQWLFDPQKRIAVIELAQASGIALIKDEDKDPLNSSTYGTGQLISEAIDQGAKEIFLTIGGSATVDAGVGLMAALGAEFQDAQEERVEAKAKNLEHITKINVSAVSRKLQNCKLTILTDGFSTFDKIPKVAIQKFPKHKAPERDLEKLRKGLANFANLIDRLAKRNASQEPASGASGGVAYPLQALFGVETKLGSKYLSEKFGLRSSVRKADLVLAGEGFLDPCSISDKSPSPLIELSRELRKPLVFLCGNFMKRDSDGNLIDWLSTGISRIIPITNGNTADSIQRTSELLIESIKKQFENQTL